MSAIPEEVASKVFGAIEVIREYLPEAAAIAEMVAPPYALEIAAGEKFLSKLFELLVTLQAHDTSADAAATLRAQTEAAWKAALQSDPR